MKKFILLFLLASSLYTNAQKEFWGYQVVNNPTPCQPGFNDGKIIKVPFDGLEQMPETVHTFTSDGSQGKLPQGRLFQASNGKLYGITSISDPGCPTIPTGTLFEYDLTLSKYTVLANNLFMPQAGLIEVSPGVLFGVTNRGASIFKYVIATNTFSIVATIPQYGNSLQPRFKGELMKASDGNLYGVTDHAPSSQNVQYFNGGIYRFNPTNNQITKRYVFGFTEPINVLVPHYLTKLVEATPGKLYGTTTYGGNNPGINQSTGTYPGSGTLFEYTIATNTIIKKFDFNYLTDGYSPEPVIVQNNKLYGTCFGDTNPSSSMQHRFGIIYQYDLTTQQMTILNSFYNDLGLDPSHPVYRLSTASDGNLYGSCYLGVYKFDVTTNTVARKIGPVLNSVDDRFELKEVIEVCRKPSYQEIIINTFDTCIGSSFTYDLQNDNATSYVWQKNGVNVTGQTTGVLNLTNITTSNAGTYTCVMTNECGTTTTMPLNLTVNCLGTNTIASLEKAIKLYPNPTNSNITIALPTNIDVKITSLKVTDLLGKEVLLSNNGTTNMDVSHLSNGIYILTLETSFGKWNGKFVKI